MKKLTKVLLSSLCVAAIGGSALSFAACGGKNSGKTEITITGSSSVSPLMSVLAEVYMILNDDVNITIQTTDSTSGVTDAQSGKNDFGMASRHIKSTETGVTEVQICTDGVALIVNNSNTTVTSVTSAEVYALYAGGTAIQNKITNAISREEGSGTRDAFDGLIADASDNTLSKLTAFADVVETYSSTGAVKSNIVSNTAGNTVGYISLGSLDSTVKALQFEGVNATVANVQNGSYTLSRPFSIAYNTATGLSSAAQDFLDFILGNVGQALIEYEGYVPLG